jgi:DeoR family transcriptional regulator of aga operon
MLLLLPVQRRQRITDFLQHQGAATLSHLAAALHVSLSTLRRDLDQLAEEGLIDRIHGGAVLRTPIQNATGPYFNAARELFSREKALIGAEAAAQLKPEQTVIFDSGSTVLEAAKAVVARRLSIHAITNSLEIAEVLNGSKAVRVNVFGGKLHQGTPTLVGEAVQSAVQHIRTDVLLLGAHAVTEQIISATSPEIAAVKQAFIRAAQHRILLVDGSKFRPRVFMSVGTLSDIDQIITDEGAPKHEQDRIRSCAITLTVARKHA